MLLKTKLVLGFFLLLALFIGSSWFSWNSLQTFDQSSKQIQSLEVGMTHILEANLAIRRFSTSQKKQDAETARLEMQQGTLAIEQAMAHGMGKQQTTKVAKVLQQIVELQAFFEEQEQEIGKMNETVSAAIAASNTAFAAISKLVNTNIEHLRKEALPHRIEAAHTLDTVKGSFLIGRTQFATYRSVHSDATRDACLMALTQSLESAQSLDGVLQSSFQVEQLKVTIQAITAYKESFEKFIVAQERLNISQQNVINLVGEIRSECKNLVNSAFNLQEIIQDTDETRTLVIAAIATALCISVAVWIILSITRPLASALTFAQRVADGDFSVHWENNSKDELGSLAVSLNKAFACVADKVFWYESVLHSLPFLLATMDKGKRFTFVNTHVQKMIGKPLEELIGKPCSTWGASICNTANCAISCIKNGKSTVVFEQPEVGHFKAIAVELRNKNKEHVGYVDMVFDISEEVRLKQDADEAIVKARQQTVTAVENIISNLNMAVKELSQQINYTSQGAAEASQRITEIATSMEEMNATVMEVARSAGEASQVSNDAKIEAESGAVIVNSVVRCINEVEDQSNQLKSDMVQLGQQAEAIGAIINVISDIADQTNLLALNAAIEAARAGEAGRGFAVVADEVRKLAEKTMQATVEVGNAVRGMQLSADKNMKGVDTSAQIIEHATELAGQAGSALKKIVHLVEATSVQVCTIATAAEEQSSTSEEINRSVGTINAASSETAHSMGDATLAVTDLSRQAQGLAQLIDDMRKG